jgi:dTDP-4-amino-4,6-dideoxygalactose transaminase
MVSTGDDEVARRVKLLRNQGMERRYENEVVGFNNRMTDIHAAIGRVQLTKLPAWTARRQEIAAQFDARFEGVTVPPVAPEATHVYHQYTIRVHGDRDAFAKALLDEHGVGSGVYYPIPNHELPSFNRKVDLPVTRVAAAEVLSLPVHPSLTQDDVDRIVEGVNACAKAGA